MSTKLVYTLVLALFAGALVLAQPALAEKGGKGNGHKPEHAAEKSENRGNPDGILLIGKEEREIIRRFLGEEQAKSCPPGLAKKNNGCLPPGIAKKYAIGKRLPNDVTARSLPERLLKLLSPPKKGQKYVMVDDDVLLIAEATNLVLDAIGLPAGE